MFSLTFMYDMEAIEVNGREDENDMHKMLSAVLPHASSLPVPADLSGVDTDCDAVVGRNHVT